MRVYGFDAVIHRGSSDSAYIIFPHDVKAEFGKSRVDVEATINGERFIGSLYNMGVIDENGNMRCVLIITKGVRRKIGKTIGDVVNIKIKQL